MDHLHVPTSVPVGASARQETIANLIRKILGNPGYVTHYEPIYGLAHSGRIMYTQRISAAAVRFPHRFSPEDVANDLRILVPSARYDPPEQAGAAKGWEIRRCTYEHTPAIIVFAAWIEFRNDRPT